MIRLKQVSLCGAGFAIIALGGMQIWNKEFVRLVPTLPPWIPAHSLLAVAAGIGLVLIGGAILADRWARWVSWGLVLLLASVLMFRVPEIMANPGAGFVWTNPAKILALIGGAILLGDQVRRRSEIAAWLLAAFLLLAGVQHFFYASFVDTLVPVWIPPGQRFWTLFSAMALVAGGLGLLIPATRRLAALMSGTMILLWVPLLHVPRSIQAANAFELAGVFEALAVGSLAWLVAATTCPSRTGRAEKGSAAPSEE